MVRVKKGSVSVVEVDTALHGMKDITVYVKRSESTVLKWIINAGFPAKKVAGGIWVSDKVLIDEWLRSQISMR